MKKNKVIKIITIIIVVILILIGIISGIIYFYIKIKRICIKFQITFMSYSYLK